MTLPISMMAAAAALLVSGSALAGMQTIQCKLVFHTVDMTETTTAFNDMALQAIRAAGACTTADGDTFEKEFVYIVNAGKNGVNYKGYSVYTDIRGDALFLSFDGGLGPKGHKGIYNIIGGTGAYSGATGDGTLTGIKAPWKDATFIDVVMNVKTP